MHSNSLKKEIIIYKNHSHFQQALRLIAFRQLHKILGIEALKPNPNRKRRSSTSATAASPTEAKIVKKEE